MPRCVLTPRYLEDFHTDKDDDEQFREEKAVIIQEISTLNQPAAAAAAQGSGRRSVDAVPTESKVVALAARPDTAPAPPTQAADASGGSIPAPPADAS